MATKLTPAQRRSIELNRAFNSIDWSDDPEVRRRRELEAQRLAAAKLAAEEAARPDFSNVFDGSDEQEALNSRGLFGAMGDAVGGWVDSTQGGLQNLMASAAQFGADTDDVLEQEDYSGATPLQVAAQQQIGQLFSFLPTALEGLVYGPEAASQRLVDEGGFTGASQSIADSMSAQAAANQQAGELAVEQARAWNDANLPSVIAGPANLFNRAATDLGGSLASMASIFGGPYGAAIAGGTSFLPSYKEARDNDLSPTDAVTAAIGPALVEGVLAKTPSGRLAAAPLEAASRRILGRELTDVVSSDIAKKVSRVGIGAFGEAGNEGVTTLAQMGVNKLLADEVGGEVGEFANSQLPANITEAIDQVVRSSAAGFLGGGAINTPMEVVKVTAERGKLAGDMLAGQRNSLDSLRQARDARALAEAEAVEQERFEQAKAQEALQRQGDMIVEEQLIAEEAARNQLRLDTGFRNPAAAFAASPVPNLNNPFGGPIVDPARGNAAPDDTAMAAQIERERQAAAADQEAADALAKRDENALKKAVSSRNARRGTFKKNLAEQAQSLPERERTAFVRDQLAEWDVNNPVPTMEQITAPSAPVSEAEQIVSSADTAALNKAKTAHNAARRKAIASTVASVRTLPDADRAGIVQQAVADWDAANPAPTAESVRATPDSALAPARGSQGRTGRSRATPVADAAPGLSAEDIKALVPDATPDEVAAAQQAGQDKLSQLKAIADANPLPSIEEAPTTTTTEADVLSSVADRLKGSDAKVVAKLVADGNVVVVPDVSYVPGNADPRGSGFYDGTTTYIVANKMSKDNTFADVMDVLLHEGRHAGDLGASSQVGNVMGRVIGLDAANKQAQLIRNLADSDQNGSELARAAVNSVPDNAPDDTKNLEVVAYFTQQLAANNGQKGAARRIGNNLTSAARTTWKRLLGTEADININDLAYLGQKLLREQAISGERQIANTSTDPLPMVVGANSPTGRRLQREGVPALRDVDGMDKVVASDIDSEFRLTPNVRSALLNGRTIKASDVLNNPNINESYPQLNNANIVVDKKLKSGAQWSDDAQTLYISEAELSLDVTNPTTDEALHGIILHELQHGIQGIEGFAQGGDPRQFRTAADRALIAKNNKKVGDWKNRVEAVRTQLDDLELDRGQRGEILQDIQMWHDGELTAEQLEGRLISALSESPARMATTLTRELEEAMDGFLVLRPDIEEMDARTRAQYMNLRGEQEAYYVQDNMNKSQEELDAQVPDGETSVVSRFDDRDAAASYVPNTPLPMIGRTQIGQRFADSAFGRKVYGQLSPYSGLGQELFDKMQTARGEAGVAAQKGEQAAARITTGFKRYAKANNITFDEASKILTERMDKINQLPSPDLRRRAFENMARTSPELAPLARAHSDIAHYTDNIIINMMRANPDPTPGEISLYNKMLDEQYRYSTRIYSAYQGRAGEQYVNNLMKDIGKGTKKLAKGKQLSELSKAEQDAYIRWENAVNYLNEHQLIIPPTDEIGSIDNDRLEYLYRSWVGDFDRDMTLSIAEHRQQGMEESEAVAAARESMLGALETARDNVDEFDLRQKSEQQLRDMLGFNTKASGGAAMPMSTHGPLNKDILKKRDDVPEPLRRLLGEITDPSTLVAVTMAKQGEMVARQKFLNDLRDNYEGVWVVPPTANDQGQFTTILDGPQWGPLQGWRARPQIANLLGETHQAFQTIGDAMERGFAGVYSPDNIGLNLAGRLLKKGAAGAKVASVILDGYGISMNALGSPFILAANGVWNPKYMTKGLSVSWDSIKNNILDQEGNLSPFAEAAIKYGILESVRVNELRASASAHIRRRVAERDTASALREKARTAGRVSYNTAIDIFAQTDVWPKVAAFADRIDVLTNYYKAEGINRTEAQIMQEAASHVKSANISSDRVPPIFKNAEAMGATTFLPYFYSVPRALTMSAWLGAMDVKRAMTEAKTPEGRMALGMSGIRRLAGTSAATYGLATITRAIANAVNDDDQEKVDEIVRMLPPESRYGDPIYLGEDEDGVPLMFRLSRADPFGPVNDQIRIMLDPDSTWDEMVTSVTDSVTGMVFANRFTGIVMDAGAAAIGSGRTNRKDLRLARLMPGVVGTARDAAESISTPDTYLGKASRAVGEAVIRATDVLTPGWMDAFDPKNSNVVPNAKEGERLGGLVIASGGKLDRADPASRSSLLGYELDRIRKEGRISVDDARRRGDDEAALAAMQRTDNRVYDKMAQLSDLYQAMTKGMGMSPRQAMSVLRDSGSIDARDIAIIARGEVPRDSQALGAIGQALDQRSMAARTRSRERSINVTKRRKELEEIRKFTERLKKRAAEESEE